MEGKVLVAYASKHGSTQEIAEKIASILGEAGLAVDLQNAKEAADPSGYDAVVIGAAAYMGRWRKEAVKYMEQHKAALAARPTWLFMSGPTGKGDPKELLKGVIYPPGMQPLVDALKPKDIKPFHGNSSAENFGGWEKWILKKVSKEDAADFRDWDDIAAWAKGIAGELKK